MKTKTQHNPEISDKILIITNNVCQVMRLQVSEHYTGIADHNQPCASVSLLIYISVREIPRDQAHERTKLSIQRVNVVVSYYYSQLCNKTDNFNTNTRKHCIQYLYTVIHRPSLRPPALIGLSKSWVLRPTFASDWLCWPTPLPPSKCRNVRIWNYPVYLLERCATETANEFNRPWLGSH